MNDDLILQTLQEIKEQQRTICAELANINTAQAELQMELALSRNGFAPHEIVSILHFAHNQKMKAEVQSESIRRAFVNWIVPVACGLLVSGAVFMMK